MRALVIVAMLAACRGREATCTEGVHAAEAAWEIQRSWAIFSMAIHGFALTAEAQRQEQGPTIVENMIEHCRDDDWPDTVIVCLRAASSGRAASACMRGLSRSQTLKMFGIGPSLPETASETAHDEVRMYAAGYSDWAAAHRGKPCPDKLSELDDDDVAAADADANPNADPWGHPYQIVCGPTAPREVKGLGVVSAGPDGELGTADDIESWE